MTPCDSCGRHHFGLTCGGFPLMLLDDVDEPECPLCHDPRCEAERVCATCKREGAELARNVTLPMLAELWWRRVNASILSPGEQAPVAQPVERRTQQCVTRVAGSNPVGSLPGETLYSVVAPGTLAALGLALGSLAPLAALLGGWS